MSLRLLGKEAFIEAKKEVFFPSRAITSPQHLFGRKKQLDQIDRAFSTEGKQVFVFGERGVGKTSLAKTAAFLHQSSDNVPVLVAIEPTSTFQQIIRQIVQNCLPAEKMLRKSKEARYTNLGINGISRQTIKQIEDGDVPELTSINEAVVILKYISQIHSDRPVVIIDEFDRLESDVERRNFADFIKQISDQELEMKFIFCGIANDIDSLIGQHFSAGRYMAPVEVGPLPADALWNIFEFAEEKFGIFIDKEIKIRASIIADGYPYFMHLIGDSMLWEMYSNGVNAVDEVSPELFDKSVKNAVEEAEPMLKHQYDTATQKYEKKDYHQVLWAVSAVKVFPKKWKDIYQDYYKEMVTPYNFERLNEDSFYKRLLNLTKPAHGQILSNNENGWYRFRENVVRSYVRLRAAEAGIDLDIDLPGGLSGTSKTTMPK